ncbi:LysR substrate-binding domain-containing protein [Aestuariivirga sp.]|uniref:LysR substrate-binding domain-containing protein n=1 Tax=Aestuariivirga sp. TaxID=2650926 RepID=UPI00391AC454
MADDLPHLPWLRSFEAAARRLNFTLAAEELGLTQAAVSQQIKALEHRLGVSLFRRGRRGVELSADGAAYLPHVQAAFASLSHTTAELFGSTRSAELRLVTPASFGALWLAPRLAAFTAAVPGVALAVSTMTLPGDYAAAEADLEIRFGTGSWPGLQSHRLTTEYLTPVASPSLASEDWQEMPLLTVRGAREMWRDWFMMAGRPAPARAFHSFDTFLIALEAAKAGAGILLGSRPLVDAALLRGDLVRLSDLDLPSPSGHFLSYRAEEAQSPAHRAAVNWFLREAGRAPSPPTV